MGRRSPDSMTPEPLNSGCTRTRGGGSTLQGSLRAARSPHRRAPRRPFPALPLSWPKVCGSHGAWLQAGRAQALPVHQHHLGAVWVDGVAPRNREEGSASIPGVAPWAWASGLSSSVLVSYIRVEVTNIPNAISSPNVWCHCTPNHV